MMAFFLRILVFVAVIYLMIGITLGYYQEKIIFKGAGLRTPIHPKPDWIEEITVNTSDGKFLTLWRSLNFSNLAPTCIYFHGNSENISHRVKFYERLTNAGCNIYAMSFRGYYGANFSPSIKTFYSDIDDFYNKHLKNSNDLYVIGYSLGGAAASYFAFRNSVKKLVLVSTFADLHTVALDHVFYRLFIPFIKFEISNLQFLGNTKADEIFIVHGLKDSVVSPRSFYKLRSTFESDQKFRFKSYSELNHANIMDGAWFDIKDFLFPPETS